MSWEIGLSIYLVGVVLTFFLAGVAHGNDSYEGELAVALTLGLLWPLVWTCILIAIIIIVLIGLRLLFRQVYKTIQDKKRTEFDNPVDPAEIEPLPLKGNGAEI